MWSALSYVIGSGSIGTILVLVVKHIIAKSDSAREQQDADRQAREAQVEKERRIESQVTLDMLLKVGDLSRTCGVALRDVVHVNGEMAAAIGAYDKSRENVTGYLVRKNADNQ